MSADTCRRTTNKWRLLADCTLGREATGGLEMTAKAIVIGHGDFAAGMVTAVDKITGQGAALLALSVQDRSLVQIEAWLRENLEKTGAQVVFTDLQAGSATMAARKTLRS